MKVLVGCVALLIHISLINSYEINHGGLKEFDKCITSSGSDGVCRPVNKCPHFLNGKMRGFKPRFCRIRSLLEVQKICCPTEDSAYCGRSGYVTASKEYINYLRSFNLFRDPLTSDPHVVNGVNSSLFTWPWMVLLGYASRGIDDPEFFCSGVLINDRFVLTAAHCVQVPAEAFFLRLGEFDYKNSNDGANPQDVAVESVFIHPKYEKNLGYNDLAIVKLAKQITFDNAVRPICLPWDSFSHRELVNTNVILTGWGAKHYNGPPSHILQEANVTIFDSSKCDESYSTLPDYEQLFPQGITMKNFVCASDPVAGKDSCQGDSGGPLVHLKPGTQKYYLAGIVSRGFGCGFREFPGLYAPVRNRFNLQWIKEVAFTPM